MIKQRQPAVSRYDEKKLLAMKDVAHDIRHSAKRLEPIEAGTRAVTIACAVLALALALLLPGLLKIMAIAPVAGAGLMARQWFAARGAMSIAGEIADGIPKGNFAVFADRITKVWSEEIEIPMFGGGTQWYICVTSSRTGAIPVTPATGHAAENGDAVYLIRDAITGSIPMAYLEKSTALDADLTARMVN